FARVRRGVPGGGAEEMSRLVGERCSRAGHLRVADLHDETTLAAVRRLAPDLGVVVATYRLRPELFTIPRLGTLNLHFGLAPDYRGSSPGFWELYDGTPESGVTVHWVNEALDAGDILRQERYPLDIAPPGDPLAYLDRYWRGVLRPNGVRLLAEVVDALRRGPLPAVPQDPARARTRPRATWRDKLELRQRVRAR
ncbi:MAG TPA: formyltransferase family protein, partial [Gemmatimonadales bacterium]|nr:formyltransferase family protein [Gemmatimonadales bacterium]